MKDEKKIIYNYSPFIKIYRENFKNKYLSRKNFHQIKLQDAAMVILVNNKKQILFLNEYRRGIKQKSLGFPGGHIEKGETPLTTVKRELLEETGYTANSFDIISDYIVSGSYMFSKLTFILVSDIEKKQVPNNKDLENPEIIWMNMEKVKLALKNNNFIGITYATGALHWILNEK